MYGPQDVISTPYGDIPWSQLYAWLVGFVRREYSHVSSSDMEDLIQEGCIKIIEVVKDLQNTNGTRRTPALQSKQEYVLYIKACSRHAIRDYILKLRSRFGISLFKLRKQLKQSDQDLNEYMSGIGNEYLQAYIAQNESDHAENEVRQYRLDLLSRIQNRGITDSLESNRQYLASVIHEYRNAIYGQETSPKTRESPILRKISIRQKSSHVRTPVYSEEISKEKKEFHCNSVFCNRVLPNARTVIVYRGHAYCSNMCKRKSPPAVLRAQVQYNFPIVEIVRIAMILFRSRKRVAEIVGIPLSVLESILNHEKNKKSYT